MLGILESVLISKMYFADMSHPKNLNFGSTLLWKLAEPDQTETHFACARKEGGGGEESF